MTEETPRGSLLLDPEQIEELEKIYQNASDNDLTDAYIATIEEVEMIALRLLILKRGMERRAGQSKKSYRELWK